MSNDTAHPSFEYSVRVSPRARRINFRVTPEDGLTIVVPRRCREDAIYSALAEKRAWIEKALGWAAEQRRLLAARPPLVIPSHIDLPALAEGWRLETSPTAASSARVIETGFRTLRLSGNTFDTAAAAAALRRWLSRRARQSLEPRLRLLAGRHGFQAGGVSIRNQRSCWASCSPSGAVSLNVKLLFLPPDLVDYVLLHELCHTVQLDHSRRFWSLVGSVDPDFRRHRRELTGSWDSVPGWLSP